MSVVNYGSMAAPTTSRMQTELLPLSSASPTAVPRDGGDGGSKVAGVNTTADSSGSSLYHQHDDRGGNGDGSNGGGGGLGSSSSGCCGGGAVETYLTQDIDTRWADLALLLSYVATGLLDSVAVHTWGSFVSMQTGNTVYIGLGLAAPTEGKRWLKSLTSLCCFCFGSFVFSRYHSWYHPKRRWVLAASYGLQAVLVCFSALIVNYMDGEHGGGGGTNTNGNSNTTSGGPDELRWQVLVPIAIIAFQSSAQAQISRAVGYKGLTSVVLTSIYCDLFGDLKLFAPLTQNTERNHRIAAPLLLCLGALLGGRWSMTDYGVAGALWTAAGLKLVTLLAWLLWPRDRKKDAAVAGAATAAITTGPAAV